MVLPKKMEEAMLNYIRRIFIYPWLHILNPQTYQDLQNGWNYRQKKKNSML